MSERDEQQALFANEAFYRAFCDRDEAAMRDVWAEHAPVACCHPGWGPLFGRDAVLESWSAIMTNPASPAIVCHDARALLVGDSAIVVCFEEMEDGYTVATNLFVREDGRWRLAHHHAGATADRPARRRRAAPPGTTH